MEFTGEYRDGEIELDGIRYVLMRPDVLMGTAKSLGLPQVDQFLRALETSAFQNVQSSFEQYPSTASGDGLEFFRNVCDTAARLGWGVWSPEPKEDGSILVWVRNSPFAAGFGAHPRPVCAPILGVLRALSAYAFGAGREVTEMVCTAQGQTACQFRVGPPTTVGG